jgi:hypothetical protein
MGAVIAMTPTQHRKVATWRCGIVVCQQGERVRVAAMSDRPLAPQRYSRMVIPPGCGAGGLSIIR